MGYILITQDNVMLLEILKHGKRNLIGNPGSTEGNGEVLGVFCSSHQLFHHRRLLYSHRCPPPLCFSAF